eukprot:GHVL01035681.1.p1 GENE.GHVL01035681.1~~GHVL01035681.1.p1  ORF type:complete len:357 (+),score=131.51 GHVL01035681.1:139-1209(+)
MKKCQKMKILIKNIKNENFDKNIKNDNFIYIYYEDNTPGLNILCIKNNIKITSKIIRFYLPEIYKKNEYFYWIRYKIIDDMFEYCWMDIDEDSIIPKYKNEYYIKILYIPYIINRQSIGQITKQPSPPTSAPPPSHNSPPPTHHPPKSAPISNTVPSSTYTSSPSPPRTSSPNPPPLKNKPQLKTNIKFEIKEAPKPRTNTDEDLLDFGNISETSEIGNISETSETAKREELTRIRVSDRLKEDKISRDQAAKQLTAKMEIGDKLKDELDKWCLTKDYKYKDVRILLSTINTVLWYNTDWINISIGELLSNNAIVKRTWRKAVLYTHPDKHQNSNLEEQYRADRIFQALNEAPRNF